jgi:hypothetical protein
MGNIRAEKRRKRRDKFSLLIIGPPTTIESAFAIIPALDNKKT